MITLFVLESVNDDFYPVVYAIPLEKQLEVENIAKGIGNVDDPESVFEDELTDNDIEYEWIGFINTKSYEERQVDWIDDKIPRELVGVTGL